MASFPTPSFCNSHYERVVSAKRKEGVLGELSGEKGGNEAIDKC
jgi:hypothetical protein